MKYLIALTSVLLLSGCAAYVQPGVVAVTPAPVVYTAPVVYSAPVVYPVYRPYYGRPYYYGRPWYGRPYYY